MKRRAPLRLSTSAQVTAFCRGEPIPAAPSKDPKLERVLAARQAAYTAGDTREVARLNAVLLVGDAVGFQRLALSFERHGFRLTNTGGNCTALVRVCADGSEIFLTSNEDAFVPDSLTDEILVATCPMGPNGHPECEAAHEWRGTAAEYLALLDAIETVLGPGSVPVRVQHVHDSAGRKGTLTETGAIVWEGAS